MPRMGVLSDTHLGHDFGGPTSEDSFVQASEALDRLLAAPVDLVLHAGDLFDAPVPKPDVLGRALRILSRAALAHRPGRVRLLEAVGKDRDDIIEGIALAGVPVVAIHGTHERRPRGLLNPVQLLERAGLLVALHCQSVLLEVGGERVGVHGMGGVPEPRARDVLASWAPRPFAGAVNVLLIHQNLAPDLYTGEDTGLERADLPPGFDLVVAGHIHWDVQSTLPQGGRLLAPGSTLLTQLRSNERDRAKRAFSVEVEGGRLGAISPIPLATPRAFLLEEVRLEDAGPAEAAAAVREAVSRAVGGRSFDRAPLVRVRVTGTLKDGVSPRDLQLGPAASEFADRALVKVDRALACEGSALEASREVAQKAASADELAREVLRERCRGMGVALDVEAVYDLLLRDDADGVLALVERGAARPAPPAMDSREAADVTGPAGATARRPPTRARSGSERGAPSPGRRRRRGDAP